MRRMRIVDRLLRRYRQDGIAGVFKQLVVRALSFAHWKLHEARQDRLETHPTAPSYIVREDETVGMVPSEEERLYRPFPRLPFQWSIDALEIDPAEFTFVDVGSGRGRIVLSAAQLGFRKVSGIEFARSLHDDACRNIENYPEERLLSRDIVSLHVNAAAYEFPPGDLVVFFFNPFVGDCLDRVASNLVESGRRSERLTYVIFAAGARESLFLNQPAFVRIKQSFFNRIKLSFLTPFPVTIYRSETPTAR